MSFLKGDKTKAKEYYLQACEQENVNSLFQVGLFYEYGLEELQSDNSMVIFKKNLKKSYEYYKRAAKLGSKSAQECLDNTKFQAFANE